MCLATAGGIPPVMNIPTPVSAPRRSKARVLAAAKAKSWRNQRKAEADADAAIVTGLVTALSGYVTPEGRMKCKGKAVAVHEVVVEAMAALVIATGIEAADAKARIVARLTHAATSRP